MSCTRYGAPLSPGAKFCAGCGKAVPPPPVPFVAGVAFAPSASGPMPGYAPPTSPIELPPAAPAAPPMTNGLAVASLVLGIVWIYWIGSILALIFGYIAKKQIDESNGREGGRSIAVAGIVLGW